MNLPPAEPASLDRDSPNSPSAAELQAPQISEPSGINRWLLTLLIAMFLTSVAALGFFFPHAKVNTLEFEVAKAVLQLGVVSVIGVMVSLFSFEYQRARQL